MHNIGISDRVISKVDIINKNKLMKNVTTIHKIISTIITIIIIIWKNNSITTNYKGCVHYLQYTCISIHARHLLLRTHDSLIDTWSETRKPIGCSTIISCSGYVRTGPIFYLLRKMVCISYGWFIIFKTYIQIYLNVCHEDNTYSMWYVCKI